MVLAADGHVHSEWSGMRRTASQGGRATFPRTSRLDPGTCRVASADYTDAERMSSAYSVCVVGPRQMGRESRPQLVERTLDCVKLPQPAPSSFRILTCSAGTTLAVDRPSTLELRQFDRALSPCGHRGQVFRCQPFR